jgi:hypothetical protein
MCIRDIDIAIRERSAALATIVGTPGIGKVPPRARAGQLMKDPGNLGGSGARRCPGGRRCSSDGETEEVPR